MSRELKVAICGTRGIPANYGGFETFAEELSSRLVQKGYKLRVYCRTKSELKQFKGVELCYLPTLKHKYLETICHSLFSFIHLLFYPVDIVLICNGANSPFSWIPRARSKVILNVDGIERMRAKWNSFGKLWYRLGEYSSTLFPNVVVSDAQVIRDYYLDKYKLDSTVITYGYSSLDDQIVFHKLQSSQSEPLVFDSETLSEFGLTPNNYILYVSRFEPENNPELVVKAYEQLKLRCVVPKLVMVGDAPYAKEYISRVKSFASSDVVFTGFRFGKSYRDLQLGAGIYIQATEVGGTHPALVEAMGFANAIVANDTPENREVLFDCGLFYEKNNLDSLVEKLEHLLKNPSQIQALRALSRKRAERYYSWDNTVIEYQKLFSAVLETKKTC